MNKLMIAPMAMLAVVLVPAAAPADLPQGAAAPDFTTASALAGLIRLVCREREREYLFRRVQRGGEKCRERLFRNSDLVSRDRQSSFHNVEDAFRRPAVALWVMKDTLRNPVGLEVGRGKEVLSRRE